MTSLESQTVQINSIICSTELDKSNPHFIVKSLRPCTVSQISLNDDHEISISSDTKIIELPEDYSIVHNLADDPQNKTSFIIYFLSYKSKYYKNKCIVNKKTDKKKLRSYLDMTLFV